MDAKGGVRRIILVITLFWSAFAHGQGDILVSEIGQEQGLEHAEVLGITEDAERRLWYIGRRGSFAFNAGPVSFAIGLYDGYKCHEIALESDTAFVQQTAVNTFALWGDSLIVISTEYPNRVFTFNPRSLEILPVLDAQGRICTPNDVQVYDGKLYLLLPQTDSTSAIFIGERNDRAEIEVPAATTFLIADDQVWLSHRTYIARYDTEGTLLGKYNGNDLETDIATCHECAEFFIGYEIDGQSVLGFSNKKPAMHKYSVENDQFEPFEPFARGKYAYNIALDSSGNRLNVCSALDQSEVAVVLAQGGMLELTTTVDQLPRILSWHSDNYAEHVWIGTRNGLFYLDYGGKPISFILSGYSVRTVIPFDSNQFIITTESGGWFWYDRITSATRPYDGIRKSGTTLTGTHGIADMGAYGLWTQSRYAAFPLDGIDDPSVHVTPAPCYESFVKLDDRHILIGCTSGQVVVFDVSTGATLKRDIPDGPRIHGALPVDKTHALVASASGLFLMNFITGEYKARSLTSDQVLSLFQTTDGDIYAGTLNGDLFEIAVIEDSIEPTLAFHVGEPVATINEDDSGLLWAGTYNGIFTIDEISGKIIQLPSNLLAHPECNRFSSYFDPERQLMLIGTVAGMNIIDVRRVSRTSVPSEVYVSSFSSAANGKNVSTVILPETQGSFEVPAANRYTSTTLGISPAYRAKDFKFQYRVGDEPWKDLKSIHTLELPFLQAGEYTLDIQGIDASGIETNNHITVQLIVLDYFYRRPWFMILLSALIISVITFWVYRLIGERKRLQVEVDKRTEEIRRDKRLIEEQANQLMLVNAAKNRFFANVSHELKTPLTLIRSPLNKIMNGGATTDNTYYYRLIKDNTDLLNERVDELLELSRLEARKVTLQTNSVSLRAFCDQCIRPFLGLASDKDIELKISNLIAPETTVITDEKRLRKIVSNLVSNALKYTPASGTVSVSFNMAEDVFRVEVADSGIGISKEDLGHIFERFYQVDSHISRANPGTGIGLAMVREYVDLLGGQLDVRSEIGTGSSFNVQVPLKAGHAEPHGFSVDAPVESPIASDTGSRASGTGSANTPSLLIVEDNHDLQQYVSHLLSDRYHITVADHGLQALEILNSGKPVDIILSDVMMPQMDGISLLREVRNSPGLAVIPFVFLTARNNDRTMLQAYRLGVDDYVKKPFSEEALKARLNAVYQNYMGRIAARQEVDGHEEAEEVGDTGHPLLGNTFADLVREYVGHPEFGTEFLADKLSISRRTLIRRIKQEVGVLPKDLIREVQLDMARRVFESGEFHDVSQVAESVGFTDKQYFQKIYRERFGVAAGA